MRSEHPEPVVPDGYEIHYSLAHREMVPFVQHHLRNLRNPFVIGYWLFNIGLVLSLGLLLVFHPVSISEAMSKSFFGIAAFFLLIPLHELIHGLAYKCCGATTVSYHAEPRKLMFYALADHFVIGYKKFMIVAFSPFLLLTSILLIFLLSTTGGWAWFAWAGLMMHTSGCAGDFALAAYFYENRRYAPLTYDLKDEGLTIFLRRTIPST